MNEPHFREFDDGLGNKCSVRHYGNIGEGEQFEIGGVGYFNRRFTSDTKSVDDFSEEQLRRLLRASNPRYRPPRARQ